MRGLSLIPTFLAGSIVVASAGGATALPAAKLLINVKITATADKIDADALAHDYCQSRGYDKVAGYENRLIVRSAGYVRFATLRCAGEAKAADGAAD